MKHILITGCNRGIGQALAMSARNLGWQVTGTARKRDGVPDGISLIDCDMGDIDALGSIFQDLPPLDVLINNAGIISPERQAPLDMDFAGFLHTLKINTLAPLATTQACLPALRKRPGSRVLSVSSQMAFMGFRKSDRIAYRASKAALNKVMQGVATDLEPEGIAVALIDPGWVKTEMGGPKATETVGDVAEGILKVAENLKLADTGKFFRFSGEERSF